MSEDYGLSVTNNGKTLNLTSDSIVSLSYIQTISKNDGTDVDLSLLSNAATNWMDSYTGSVHFNNSGAYYTGDTNAKRHDLQDNTLNKNNIFMAVSSFVDSIDDVLLEPWRIAGGFCIYDQDTNAVYHKGETVTCFFGATL